MEDEDNIIPYEASPTLTVKQAVMYMLGYRGDYTLGTDTEEFEYDLHDYLRDLQEEAEAASSEAAHDLKMLNRDDDAPPDAIKAAEEKAFSTKAELDKANKLSVLAEQYRLLIDHEISKVRLGMRSLLVLDEDETTRTGQLRIHAASFLKWFEVLQLDDADVDSVPVKLPIVDNDFDREMELTKDTTESLFLTLGLLVSLYAEAVDDKCGTGMQPIVSNISEKIDEHGKRLNKGKKLVGQGKSAVIKRIDVALSALHSSTFIKISF